MTDRDVIALQSWWMGELSTLTKKLMDHEEKRQQKAKANALKMFGDLSIERREDIDDLYGYGVISDKKREKLIDMWEQGEHPTGLYQAKLDLLQDAYRDAKQVISDCTNRLGGNKNDCD
jgi:hypothetical protein